MKKSGLLLQILEYIIGLYKIQKRKKETTVDWSAQRQFSDKTHRFIKMYKRRKLLIPIYGYASIGRFLVSVTCSLELTKICSLSNRFGLSAT